MKTHRLKAMGVVAAVVVMLVVPAHARSRTQSMLAIKSQSAIYEASTGMVKFRIVFNRPPDFFTADDFDRQADSFQYFVGSATLPQVPTNFDSIIRGEEIHSTGLIPIRNAFPPDPLATSGWGTIRGEVTFTLHGRVLRFSAPLSMLTDRVGLSVLPYQLEVYEFGSWTGVTIIDFIRLTTS